MTSVMHEHLRLHTAHLLEALIRCAEKKVQPQMTTWQRLRLTAGRAQSAVEHQPTPQQASQSPFLWTLQMKAPSLSELANCLRFLHASETLT